MRFPVVIALNKVDKLKDSVEKDALLRNLRERFQGDIFVPMSAKFGDGVTDVVSSAVSLCTPTFIYHIHRKLTGSSATVSTLEPSDVEPLIFRPGATVHDVYLHLHQHHGEQHLSGEFIRAELITPEGERIVLRKNEPLRTGSVVKCFTNKKHAWQG